MYKWYLTDVDSYGVLDPVVGSTPAAELDKLVNRIQEKLEDHGIILRPIRHSNSDEAREQAEATGIGFSEAYAMIQEQRRATVKHAHAACRDKCKATQGFAPGALCAAFRYIARREARIVELVETMEKRREKLVEELEATIHALCKRSALSNNMMR